MIALPQLDTPVFSSDPDEALDAVERSTRVALDLETTGLDPHGGQIGLVILRADEQNFLLREVPPWMGDLLETDDIRKVGFNLKFDLSWLQPLVNVPYARNVSDLYLKELLVSDTRRGVKHNLQASLERRLGVTVAKDVDHAQVDWTGDLSDEMIAYALEDVQYLEALDDELDRLLWRTKQVRAAEIENDAVPTVAWMAYNGVPIDREAWLNSTPLWSQRALEALESLESLAPEVENWNSWQQVLKAIQTHDGLPLPNTRHETLELYREESGIAAALIDYRYWSKRLGNWGVGFVDNFVNPTTGRVHPSWWQLGTDTGRFSCSRPNFQQIPHDQEFRDLIRARPGHWLASLDYSQIEVLVAAIVASDNALLNIFLSGSEDVHRSITSQILGIEESAVTDQQRRAGKATTFGLLFGGGAGNIVRQARTTYKVELTEDEAKAMKRAFHARFQGLKRRRNMAYSTMDYAVANGQEIVEVRNLIGMRRILAGERRRATTYLNTEVQSTAGYGIKAALRRIGLAGLAPYLCLQVHDELVFEFPGPREHAEALAEQARACMIAGMQDVIGAGMPVSVEPKVAETWQK